MVVMNVLIVEQETISRAIYTNTKAGEVLISLADCYPKF